MAGRQPGGDDAADYDVMSGDPMDDLDESDGHEWDANEMARGQGEEEPEPLDDDDDDGDDQVAEGDEESDEPELKADEEGEEGEEGPDDDEGEEYEALEPPSNWPETERQWFAELPPPLQHAYMSRAQHMVADYTRKTQAIAQERQQIQGLRQAYSEIDRIIQPRAQQWALAGMNPAQAMSQLIALSDFATNDPPGFIKYFANLRGVNLQQMTQDASQEYVDPQVAALRGPVAEVQARLNELTQQVQQERQQQQVQQYNAAFSWTRDQIDSFARQAGNDGKPLYPFFDDVVDDMAALIESGRARSMPEAYSQAVWLNENTRSKVLARSRAAENAKAVARATRARRAASSLTGASGANGAFNPGDLSIRDTINAAWTGELG